MGLSPVSGTGLEPTRPELIFLFYMVLIGMVPVLWLALLIAPALEHGNMIEVLPQITERLQDPLRIEPAEKEWESITGNCDSLVYLGGNEQSTHKYISELLGKETIDLNTFNRSYGMRGTYSKNTNLQGRELLTPDEVRMLDNRYAITLIRGVRPMKDLKYDLMKHPFIKWTADGGYDEYVHGQTPDARLSIWLERSCVDAEEADAPSSASDADTKETGFVLLSEEDIANEYDKKEKQKNEKHIA